MKYIDIDSWERKDHFHFFQTRKNPCLSLTCNINIKKLNNFRIELGHDRPRLTDCLYYTALRCANNIPEFRMRIINLRPVEFSTIHAAFTFIPKSKNLHINCISDFDDNFKIFIDNTEHARKKAETTPTLTPNRSDSQALIYFSTLPNISFTALTNPWGDPWVDTVPRILFGKINAETYDIPVSIEVLHSFIDGKHIADLLQSMSELLQDKYSIFATK